MGGERAETQNRWEYGETEKTPETGWDHLRTGEAVRQGGAQEGAIQYQHGDLGGAGGDPRSSREILEDLGQTQEEVGRPSRGHRGHSGGRGRPQKFWDKPRRKLENPRGHEGTLRIGKTLKDLQ